MTAEEIKLAFRMLGMGYHNHEQVVRLAELLAIVPEQAPEPEPAADAEKPDKKPKRG